MSFQIFFQYLFCCSFCDRIGFPLPDLSRRIALMSSLCRASLSRTHLELAALETEKFSCRDLEMVVMLAHMETHRELEGVTHFKKVHSLPNPF